MIVVPALGPFQELYDENPRAFATLVRWLAEVDYGEITLRFQGGKFTLVERTERSK